MKITLDELLTELERFKPKQKTPLEEIHFKLIDKARSWNPPMSWDSIKKFLSEHFENCDYDRYTIKSYYDKWKHGG